MRQPTRRVLGPYHEKIRNIERWRVALVGVDGRREMVPFATEREAQAFATVARRKIPGQVTVGSVLDAYELYLRDEGNKQSSITTTLARLKGWFKRSTVLQDIRQSQVLAAYNQRREQVQVATHRNELSEVKAWLRWCVKQKWLKRSPAEKVEPRGRRNRGKPKLRKHEAAAFSDKCFKDYRGGGRGFEAALGNLLALWLGLRAGEVYQLRVRDVDPHGSTWLWVAEGGGKTDNAERTLEVPGELADLLQLQVKRARGMGSSWLFPARTRTGHRGRTWLRRGAARICEAANLDPVCPHGLRGTQASLTRETGATGYLVAQQLGHGSPRVTEDHYLARGTVERDRGRRMADVLAFPGSRDRKTRGTGSSKKQYHGQKAADESA